ncbi:MAG TPA: nodulation protein NfeD [Burkholderiaceae bacterium]|jgi:membrane-bound serine protease (ClpP class)|nr:nodulation protein NfeD [Burkholderiaceae bacterium]
MNRIGRMARAVAIGLIASPGALIGVGAQPHVEATHTEAPRVEVLVIDGMINPATAEFFSHGLAQAQSRNASLLVLELDTPGGLDTSMRAIIKEILSSTIPVATWVGPAGARAASAGTYILYASHIAAMSPASNLGAATPIAIGPQAPEPAEPPPSAGRPGGGVAGPVDTLHEKMVNDAAAYLRSLAQLRGRNADFAEKAVRQAHSMSAQEALHAGVIDLIARDVDDLLAQVDGRQITVGSSKVKLALAGAQIQTFHPDWRTGVLAVLSNPTVALVLMMLGVYGLFIEVIHPGAAVPGVAGAICLLLGLYALHLLPVNWAGVGLILLGTALMIAEVFLPTFGVVGVGGIVALVVGGMMLIDSEGGQVAIPFPFLVGLAAVSAAVIFGFGTFALRARRRPVVSGREGLVGAAGVVTWVDDEGAWARVQGASWRVRSREPLAAGTAVRVDKVDGLTLEVSGAGQARS